MHYSPSCFERCFSLFLQVKYSRSPADSLNNACQVQADAKFMQMPSSNRRTIVIFIVKLYKCSSRRCRSRGWRRRRGVTLCHSRLPIGRTNAKPSSHVLRGIACRAHVPYDTSCTMCPLWLTLLYALLLNTTPRLLSLYSVAWWQLGLFLASEEKKFFKLEFKFRYSK